MSWRHANKIIYHWYINNKTAIKTFVENDKNENEEKNEAFNIQTEHRFKIEKEIYEKFIMKFLFSIKIKQTALRHVSKKWY